ncbi:SDR family NAD(P)-dependent oxidoreductase [Agromyces silvae]|uniref:SDR family NAD(P)-dependent oxidoreductase n=1 Tax=Agromyces silvae TaxID=3388266 RepID=UPI00280B2E48|nr:SDR family oxidoreductase [Agromyces protaetiae]
MHSTASSAGAVVVTGGGHGIGRAIVQRLLADSAHLVLIEFNEAAASRLRRELDPAHASIITGSASDEAIASHAIEVSREHGGLSGWVNNAAVFADVQLQDADADSFLRSVDANVRPVVVGCRSAITEFRAIHRPGTIVNLSSHQAARAVPGAAGYVTAKAAIEGFTRAMAVDQGPAGIRVNAVAPGSIVTERYTAYLDSLPSADAARARAANDAAHALHRVGRAAEVADVVRFLLSDESSFITGATIPVDGGRTVLAVDAEVRQ